MGKRRRDGGTLGLFAVEELDRIGTGRRPSQVGQLNIFGGVEVARTLDNGVSVAADSAVQPERPPTRKSEPVAEEEAGDRIEGLVITKSMTTPTRPGKQPRPVWEVTGDTRGLDEAFRELGARKYGGTWSFFRDPTGALARLTEADRLTFAELQEAQRQRAADRGERYGGYAANAEKRAETAFATGQQVLDRIPLGQPILVGHHSEKRHRRDLKRATGALRRGAEEQAKAEYWERRAEHSDRKAGAEHTVAFLQRRLEEAQAEVRKAERELAGVGYYHQEPPEGRERARWEGLLAEAQERATYWQGKLDEAGGVRYSRDSVHKGDLVKCRHGWERVVRVNRKTVSTESLTLTMADGKPWPGKYPYAEIREHRPAEQE